MSAQIGQPAKGTVISVGNGASPVVYYPIGELLDINGPSMKGAVVDVTSNSNTSAFRQKLVTLLDPGQIKFDIAYIPSDATHTFDSPTGSAAYGLGYAFLQRGQGSQGTPLEFRIQYPDTAATTDYFFGFVSDFQITAKTADVLRAAITLELTNLPSLN